ncbi:unnamed protein product [Ceutorhynchus assimilis]|uniref:Uncharacterized protein n=1 Tax=Ceutorhynchus assimilis TaxID=467358 RepID=A0A9N9QDP5_9CUCU|nr:unnamed protein product [Ceutorhynchus assimilis]
MLRTAMEKANRNVAGIPSPYKRGKHDPGVKHNNDTITFAEYHIDSFPRVPARWCRKDTKKEYLESILNKEKMYTLYKENCSELKQKCISKTTYRELLIKKNIGFHIPKKDQCWCHHFEQLKENEKTAEKLHDYEIHIRRKIAAMEEKKIDSLKAKRDEHYVSANFDLEAVLYSPLLFAKPVFYKR